jgi:hypothetical protein
MYDFKEVFPYSCVYIHLLCQWLVLNAMCSDFVAYVCSTLSIKKNVEAVPDNSIMS